MKYILTPEQMRQADRTAINEYSIPSVVLMENAARSSTEEIVHIFEANGFENPEIIILCGSGNNGGDGFAIARHLILRNFDVRILRIGTEEKMSEETRTNYESTKKIGIPIIHIENDRDLHFFDFTCDCLIDALIGVGGSEDITGLALEVMKKVHHFDALKIAIDVPSGLNSETGHASDFCFFADYTITMFAIKTGMLLNDGVDVCGKIIIAGLGAPEFIIESLAGAYILEKEDIINMLPRREKRTSKFDYGRVLIIAGSKNFPGAAAMCANASVAMGAGLTNLISPVFHNSIFPEVITHLATETDAGTIESGNYKFIMDMAVRSNVVVIGPGLGDYFETINLTKRIINDLPRNISLVIDADALKAVDALSVLRKNIILTPHCGEFAAITGIAREEVAENSAILASEWAEKMNCTILLKNVPTIISNGDVSCYNIIGNPGMAKGGSGDVLSGIIGGLLAQHVEPFEAASLGAFLHAFAGDLYVEQYAEETLTATDIISKLKEVLKDR